MWSLREVCSRMFPYLPHLFCNYSVDFFRVTNFVLAGCFFGWLADWQIDVWLDR